MKKKQDSFIEELTSLLSGKNFEVCGILSTDGKIYSLGDDSKLIGRIFEILSYRFIKNRYLHL